MSYVQGGAVYDRQGQRSDQFTQEAWNILKAKSQPANRNKEEVQPDPETSCLGQARKLPLEWYGRSRLQILEVVSLRASEFWGKGGRF